MLRRCYSKCPRTHTRTHAPAHKHKHTHRNTHMHTYNTYIHFIYAYPLYCIIVLYLYIYIALLAVHTKQKRFQCKIPREKRAVLRERKEALGSPVKKVHSKHTCNMLTYKHSCKHTIRYINTLKANKQMHTEHVHTVYTYLLNSAYISTHMQAQAHSHHICK